jgi:hypothetical protein
MVWAWDGSTWTCIATKKDIPHYSHALEMYHGYLYVASEAKWRDGTDTCFLRWDGEEWETLPAYNSFINSLKVYKDELYIGGGFSKIGNDSIPYLARFYSPDSVIYVEPPLGIERKDITRQISLYPNPADSRLYIKSEIAFTTIEIQNSVGKRMILLNKQPEDGIDISSFKKGIYILKVLSKDGIVVTEKFVKE